MTRPFILAVPIDNAVKLYGWWQRHYIHHSDDEKARDALEIWMCLNFFQKTQPLGTDIDAERRRALIYCQRAAGVKFPGDAYMISRCWNCASAETPSFQGLAPISPGSSPQTARKRRILAEASFSRIIGRVLNISRRSVR